jgi:radical SAM protein (TIGR01212 family)
MAQAAPAAIGECPTAPPDSAGPPVSESWSVDGRCHPSPALGAWGYRSYREHLRDRFPGRRIRKLCLQAGFTCPNRDGTRGHSGCTFCDNAAFAPGLGFPSLQVQWDKGRTALRERHGAVDGFIAYFQSFSNTYAPVADLQRVYDRASEQLPECVGIAIGTRPDCVPDPVLDYLQQLGRRTFLTLELGLQSDRDAVLRRIHRGHDVRCFLDAVARAAGRGFELCAHVILGLPGEGEDAPERLGALLASIAVESVKIHNLHVVRGTLLAEAHGLGNLPLPTRAAYLDAVDRLLRRLRPDQAVQRLIADAPDRLLLGPGWCHDKQGLLAELRGRRGDKMRPLRA